MKRVFIGGLGRSGTTITLNALYHHHQMFAFPVETKFLVEEDGFAALITALTREFSTPGAELALIRFETLMRRHVTGLEESKFQHQHELPTALFKDYGAAVDEFMSLVRNRYFFDDPAPLVAATRRFVDRTFDEAARAHGYDAWVEKTPSNIWHLDLLRKLWPDCSFIHCMRDPRDIMISLIQRGWLPSNVPDALALFGSVVAGLIKVRRAHIGDPNWVEVRLDSLVAKTELTLEILSKAVDIDPFRVDAVESISGVIKTYYEEKNWPATNLTASDLYLIDSWLRPAVAEFGYPLEWSYSQ